MKVLFSMILWILFCTLNAQDAGMQIVVDNPILGGGEGSLMLQSYTSKGKSIYTNTLLLDGADIQSYNQDSGWYCGTLYLQDQGGDLSFLDGNRGVASFEGNVIFRDSIKIGESIQTTASSEIAFGAIKSDADITSGSGNYEVTWTGTRYEIEIDDEHYHYRSYSTLITPNSGLVYSAYSSSGSGKIFVYLRDNDGSSIAAPFHFVTHKYLSDKDAFASNCESVEEDVIVLAKNKIERE